MDDILKRLEFLEADEQSMNSSYSFPIDTEMAIRERIKQPIFASATLDFPSTLTKTRSTLTIPLPGSIAGEPVILGIPDAVTGTGLIYSAWVSTAGTITVAFDNTTAGSVDPASAIFTVAIPKQ